MSAVLYCFVYGYILGVAGAMLLGLGPEWIPRGYWGGGPAAAAAVAVWWRLRNRSWAGRSVSLAALFAASLVLGIGRQIDRSKIPPFDPARPDDAYHLRALMEAFPDTDAFVSRTRITGRIVAEPEYFPPNESDLPGKLNILLQPESFEPDPLPPPRGDGDSVALAPPSGPTYRVSEGTLLLTFIPIAPFKPDAEEDPYRDVYRRLVNPEAYGGRVRLSLPVLAPRPALNPGAYDPEAFLSDKDIYANSPVFSWDPRFPHFEEIDLDVQGSLFTEWAIRIKTALLREIKRTLPFPESAFLGGVTLGARTGLVGVRCLFEGEGPAPDSNEPDVRNAVLDEFRWSGTSHVLAVSGLHVSIIAVALYGFFSALRIPPRVFAWLIVLCLFLFTLLVGAPPSTMRAAIMNSMVLFTIIFGKKNFSTSVLISVSTAAILILWDNPKWLFQPAFALSFMAIYSLGLLTGPTEMIFTRHIPGYTRLPGWMRAFCSAQVAIQFGMMFPLSSYYFQRISSSGPISNFLAIPLSGIIIPLGLIASSIGTIPLPGAEWVAMILNAANFVGIKIFLFAAHLSTHTPFPFVKAFTGRNLVAYFFAVFGLYASSPYWLPRLKIDLYDMRHGILYGSERVATAARWAAGGLFSVAVFVWSFWPQPHDGTLRIRSLHVGYGTSLHITTPAGRNLVVDAGSGTPGGWDVGERVVASYLLKHQIGSLEGVILTSPSVEKMSGAGRLLRILPTRRLYAPFDPREVPPPDQGYKEAERAALAELGLRTAGPTGEGEDLRNAVFYLARLRAVMEEGGTKERLVRWCERMVTAPLATLRLPETPEFWRIQAGDVLVEEAGPNGTLKITALSPAPAAPGEGGFESRVAALRIEYGKHAVLVLSDLGRRGLEDLLTLDPRLLVADAVVIPAQGAQISQSPLFFQGLDRARQLVGEGDTPAAESRIAILNYNKFDRSLKPPRRGAGGRTQRSQSRESIFPHRMRYRSALTREAAAAAEAWTRSGWRVLSVDDVGSVLLESDGAEFAWSCQVPMVEAAAGGDEEGAGQHVLREYN